MRSYWIWLRDGTTETCEGMDLGDVDAFLLQEDIDPDEILAVVCW